jgi:hypothetical protein
MDHFATRLEKFVLSTRLSITEFEKECEMSSGQVQKVLRTRYQENTKPRLLSIEGVRLIKKRFKHLNISWLILGEGSMIVDADGHSNSQSSEDLLKVENEHLKEISAIHKRLNEALQKLNDTTMEKQALESKIRELELRAKRSSRAS